MTVTTVGRRQVTPGSDPAAGHGAEFGVLNPRYPASYWMIAFSKDVRPGEVVPLRRLERDLLLWRDRSGTIHCQDHRCRQRLGRLGDRWTTRADGVIACEEHRDDFDGAHQYIVVERYDAIFVWSGACPADHELPDILGTYGLQESDVHFLQWRVMLPFPAKWFSENLPDATHFAVLHNTGDWAECEITYEDDVTFRCAGYIQGERRLLSLTPRELMKLYREDRLDDIVEFSGDLDMTVHGGGLNVFKIGSPEGEAPLTGISGLIRKFVEAAPVIHCFTPVTEDSHVVMMSLPMPKSRVPFIGHALDWAMEKAAVSRNWSAAYADAAVMTHRNERSGPSYNRLDSALIRYRRFWDRRLLDRTLGEGDNRHSNGRRAGISWKVADGSTELCGLD